jgi:hydrogenase maturation protein HypF
MKVRNPLPKASPGSSVRVIVFGVVQGVGFRPFIFRLAKRFGYKGWVKNIGFGVEIHIESATPTNFRDFIEAIDDEKPPLARIERVASKPARFLGCDDFQVKKTESGESFVFISPDISVCENCRREMSDPQDRRFRYPFINCTDCGPRYTIVKALPYDRPQTTMAGFKMCPLCAAEYHDPLDRRYHAQPIACPTCGPSISLRHAKTGKEVAGGILKAAALIKKGRILAVKGLGGFHLVCDPLNPKAVLRLRKIKARERKPFALMARDLKTLKKYVRSSSQEKKLLLSPFRPIVLLKKKKNIPRIAPHLDEMGMMLPYTPLHNLLLEDIPLIVATSSNQKDSPIIKDEEEGVERLCDFILSHNRPIQMRADDSVVKVVCSAPLFMRRARGYVPYPQKVPEELLSPHPILALGGELKDTVSLYKNGYVVTSQFLGDLDEYQNHLYFEETIRHLGRLFDVKPYWVVSDLHPNFHTTRYAQKLGIPHLQVQHHYAHVLAVLLEHGLGPKTKVLGVAWDGYGYGQDGTAWGGEFLLADMLSFERFGHFEYIPLPGGDLAAKQPWRMALAYLQRSGCGMPPTLSFLKNVERKKVRTILRMIEQDIRSPLSSSCGRLFDAVSALCGTAPHENEFEAEAAMRLEAAAASHRQPRYPYQILGGKPALQISFLEMIRNILLDKSRRISPSIISAKFHNTLARVVLDVAERARTSRGINTVVLSGGVFLNKKLLERASALLEQKQFRVLRPVKYSPNDESLSIGQVAHALARWKAGKPLSPSDRS